MTSRRILLCALFAAVFPAALSAGTLITMKEELTSGATSTHKVYLQKGNLRIETKGDERSILYRSDSGFLWVLDPGQKAYLDLDAMTGAGSPTAQGQMDAARQSIMERKDLSDVQKQQIIRRMGSGGGNHPGAGRMELPTYRQVASGVSVNGYVTDKYEVSHGGKKVGEVWMADPKALNIDPSDAAAFRWMAGKVIAQSRSQSGFALKENAPEGLPVRTIIYYNGQKASTDEFTGVTHRDLPASMFELPKDYKPLSLGPGGPH